MLKELEETRDEDSAAYQFTYSSKEKLESYLIDFILNPEISSESKIQDLCSKYKLELYKSYNLNLNIKHFEDLYKDLETKNDEYCNIIHKIISVFTNEIQRVISVNDLIKFKKETEHLRCFDIKSLEDTYQALILLLNKYKELEEENKLKSENSKINESNTLVRLVSSIIQENGLNKDYREYWESIGKEPKQLENNNLEISYIIFRFMVKKYKDNRNRISELSIEYLELEKKNSELDMECEKLHKIVIERNNQIKELNTRLDNQIQTLSNLQQENKDLIINK